MTNIPTRQRALFPPLHRLRDAPYATGIIIQPSAPPPFVPSLAPPLPRTTTHSSSTFDIPYCIRTPSFLVSLSHYSYALHYLIAVSTLEPRRTYLLPSRNVVTSALVILMFLMNLRPDIRPPAVVRRPLYILSMTVFKKEVNRQTTTGPVPYEYV